MLNIVSLSDEHIKSVKCGGCSLSVCRQAFSRDKFSVAYKEFWLWISSLVMFSEVSSAKLLSASDSQSLRDDMV